MFDITINIKTDTYKIKFARWDGGTSSSLRLGFDNTWVGKDVLLIPILDDDLLRVTELDDGYLINICSLQVFKKTVQPHHKDRPERGGRAYVPMDCMGYDILIIPVE